jgi:hypothetical protein
MSTDITRNRGKPVKHPLSSAPAQGGRNRLGWRVKSSFASAHPPNRKRTRKRPHELDSF